MQTDFQSPPPQLSAEGDASGLAIILRGLPGSGKSYWVDRFCDSLSHEAALRLQTQGIFSTDNFFMRGTEYCFDASKLAEYHQRNLAGFIEALARHEPVVICDNTNLAHWEFIAYEAAASALGYRVERVLIGEPTHPEHQKLCARRNRHGVSLAAIRKMASVFDE